MCHQRSNNEHECNYNLRHQVSRTDVMNRPRDEGSRERSNASFDINWFRTLRSSFVYDNEDHGNCSERRPHHHSR